MYNDMQAKKIDKVISVGNKKPDDIFITCGSFEERCLGVPRRSLIGFSERIVLFRFIEPNEKREILIKEMENLLKTDNIKEKYCRINVEHGKTTDSVLSFHNYCRNNNILETRNLVVTIDITTFTKSLLLDILFYLKNFLNVKKLRILYTIPKNYASPDEGELSYGIKSIHISPFYWNGWSSTKDDLLIIILGYEEMRAWSLINQFDANVNLLFVTKPGSKPEWNIYCEKYNQTLLNEMSFTDSVSALDPMETNNALEKYITAEITKKYNIFISPLGTKPQMIGIFLYLLLNPKIPLNIITTTPIEHNIPYYSWGVGTTFQFFLPLCNFDKNLRKSRENGFSNKL